MLIKLANFFGVSIDYLICNNEIPYPVKSAERYMLNEKESEFIEIVRKISPEQEAILFEIMKQFVKAQEPAKKSLSEIKILARAARKTGSLRKPEKGEGRGQRLKGAGLPFA